jgi:hypothetical protein
MDNNSCSTKSCGGITAKCVLSFIAVFATITVVNIIGHGQFLMNDYAPTANLWRALASMESYRKIDILRNILTAFAICGLYKKIDSSCKKTVLCFGLMVGLIPAAVSLNAYTWTPFIIGMLEGLLSALVLSLICKKSCSKQ